MIDMRFYAVNMIDPDVEFFHQLPFQTRQNSLFSLDLAAGELPFEFVPRAFFSPADEDGSVSMYECYGCACNCGLNIPIQARKSNEVDFG